MTASRERDSLKILPTDGSRACRPIGMNTRQLGQVREDGKIVDHGDMKEGVVPFGKQEYVNEISCNT